MGGSSSSSSSSEGSFYNSGGEGYGIADKLENELIKKVPSASLDSGNFHSLESIPIPALTLNHMILYHIKLRN